MMTKTILAAILFMSLTACSEMHNTLGCPSELDDIVLDALVKESTSNFGTRIPQQRINTLREWAQKQPDRCTRNTYLNWLDVYQRELDEDAARERNDEQKAEYENAHSVAKPPPSHN